MGVASGTAKVNQASGSGVGLHLVIGGAAVSSSTEMVLVHGSVSQQQLVSNNQEPTVDVPIATPGANLPGYAVGCQVRLLAKAANQPWAVSIIAVQGGVLIGTVADHGVLAAAGAADTSTLWLSFQ